MKKEQTSEYWIIPKEITVGIVNELEKTGDRKTYISTIADFIAMNHAFKTKAWARHENIGTDPKDPITTLLRTLNLTERHGIRIKNGNVVFLDILCYLGFTSSWIQTLQKFNIK